MSIANTSGGMVKFYKRAYIPMTCCMSAIFLNGYTARLEAYIGVCEGPSQLLYAHFEE